MSAVMRLATAPAIRHRGLRKARYWLFMLLVCGALPLQADDEYDRALQQVKALSCLDYENVDAYLNRKLKPSHRDLGWQVFKNDHGYDVERSFMVSKSMELRYRWRLSHNGELSAISDRAKSLCS